MLINDWARRSLVFGSLRGLCINVQVGGKIVDIVVFLGSGRGVHIVDICAHIVDIVDLSGF